MHKSEGEKMQPEITSDWTGLEIAIVGMSGRFPGAETVEAFWRNLAAGVESITTFSEAELEAAGVAASLLRDPNYVKAGAVLDDIALFDAGFFGLTPREATITDPQHRLFLECAWEALEHAGYDPQRYAGAIGVYAGAGMNGYDAARPGLAGTADEYQTRIGNDKDFLATRVAYKLNLRGPSITIQTACSTSLVAIHLASQGLLSGECDVALAGGVSIRVPHTVGYLHQPGGITAPDGHCRAFDAQAQGTVGGSGVGIVVLKRLEDALADHDSIYAVIKGSAINNDGARKVGYTAPSVEGQAQVIQLAQRLAGVDPATISYIEAHGTGTALGDPIEIAALTRAFQAQTAQTGFCAVGSLKTNVGHLDTAAGVAAVIKTALALTHRQLPPSLHFRTPNPAIDFANSPFYVNTTLAEWSSDTPRRAGVSSFGMGGTNAHAILEEAPPVAPSDMARPWQLLVLSAKTVSALEQMTAHLAAHLTHPDRNLADVAYTLQLGRQAFSYRRAVVCRDQADAVLALNDPSRMLSATYAGGERPVVFMFPGQGSQYAQMARELYQDAPVFRAVVDQCAELLLPHLGCDIRDVLYPPEGSGIRDQGSGSMRGADWQARPPTPDPRSLALDQTQYAQPALFVIAYALAQLWLSWGVRPQAMIGHSIGEYVAACLAGVFSLEDALALVALRGRLMQSLPTGAMLAIGLSEQALLPLLHEPIALAAVNGPAQCVVAGPLAAVAALEQQLTTAGVTCRRLATSHAFHSSMMDPIHERFTAYVQQLALRAPQIPYVSNVTGTWISAAEATDPQYWARHLRETVRFGDGLRTLAQEQQCFLEVGPGRTLTTRAKQHPDMAVGAIMCQSLRHPSDEQSDRAVLLTALGRLWLAGVAVAWEAVSAHEQRQRVPLPTYPFERQRYWHTAPAAWRTAGSISAQEQRDLAGWFAIVETFLQHSAASAPQVPMPADEQMITQAAALAAFEQIRASGIIEPAVVALNARAGIEPVAHAGPRDAPEAAAQAARLQEQMLGLQTTYAAPRSEIEQALAGIWQRVLGIALIGIYDNFFELGGDSLQAIQLIASVRDTLQIELMPHSLLQAPTISAFAALCAPSNSTDARSVEPGSLHPALVAIRSSGTRTPLFLVHPVGGGVYIYRELAQLLGAEQPVYGLQAEGFDGIGEALTRIEAMAAHCIEAITTVQPAGPYLLGGASFGGIVAFEMAQQLQARGEEVALLTIMDATAPQEWPTIRDELEILALILNIDYAQLSQHVRSLDADAGLRYCMEQMQAAGEVPADFELLEFRRFLHLLTVHFQAASSYTPQVYDGQIIFFSAAERDRLNPPHPEYPWLPLAEAGIIVHEIPGNHYSMHDTPNVQVMAARLTQYIELAAGVQVGSSVAG
jgi:acyl transferase domain-containing protein/thioesterase domain-containing protein